MNEAGPIPRRGNLTESVINALSSRIDTAAYAPGRKLPSEQELCREFGVSRTVIREAVASLRLGGKLYARQGLGVFVTERDARRLGFALKADQDTRSALQILELRLGIETEAVALAAARRTPADIADLTSAYDRLLGRDEAAVDVEAAADFDFHLAIARATGNPHFPQFMEALKPHITTDLRLKLSRTEGASHKSYIGKVVREHGTILSAIGQGDPKAARSALRHHIEESIVRHRRLIDADGQTSPKRTDAPRPS